MAQYAMVAFQDCIVADGETTPAFPHSRDLMRYLWMTRGRLASHVLFTKRNFGWFREDDVRSLAQRVRSEGTGLIMIVRDPRDVLCSRHARRAQTQAYVTEEHWARSIEAGNRLIGECAGHENVLTIRYEDFVRSPTDLQTQLQRVFQVRLRPGVTSIGDIKDNLALYPYPLAQETVVAMHGMRNVSPSSVGRWREMAYDYRVSVKDPIVRQRISTYIEQFGYDQ